MVCKRSLKHLQRFFSLETNQEILKSLFPPFSHNLPHLTKYHVIFNFDFNEHHFLNHHFCKLGFQNKLDLNLTLSLILFSFISQKNKKNVYLKHVSNAKSDWLKCTLNAIIFCKVLTLSTSEN